MSEKFQDISYRTHSNHYETVNEELGATWTKKDTVDYWRHERMYRCIAPIIDSHKGAKWLTIGDGRYGTDANYILSKGEDNVIATDIGDTYLKTAKEKGFIKNYQVENAEDLSLQDESVDFVLCKESYHHFPRPMIALNEFLRVARKGIILIEPRDPNVISTNYAKLMLRRGAINLLKKFIGKPIYYEYGNYEPVGNYVYTISEREIEKVALGLNYDLVAFKGLNDCYSVGVENELKKDNGKLFQQVNKGINDADVRVKMGKAMPGLLVAVIFKEMPSIDCLESLEKEGFMLKKLPKNPYF